MNIIAERVKNTALTRSQRQIAEFFIQNYERIGTLSSMEVAKEIGVSDASIIRFSRAIGYEGYTDLKTAIYNMLVENANGGPSLSQRLAQNAEKHGGGSAQFLELMHRNLDAAFRDNAPEDFERVAQLLVDAEERYVVGVRGCRGVATQMGRLLTYMLPRIHTLADAEQLSVDTLQDISGKDMLLLFAFSRFYTTDIAYLQLARQHGVRIALVTDNATSPLGPYADIVLLAETSGTSFYHSMIGAELIVEYLANLVGTRVDCRERIEERDRLTSTQRL